MKSVNICNRWVLRISYLMVFVPLRTADLDFRNQKNATYKAEQARQPTQSSDPTSYGCAITNLTRSSKSQRLHSMEMY